MANEIFENMWKIMKENKFELINEINHKLLCNICNKLMVKACNACCGCKYCSECIENYLDSKNKFCPGKDRFCQMKMINFERDVVIDYRSNIRISEIVVKCPNKYCDFTDELNLIENHLRTCDKNPTNCPYFEIGCKNDEVRNDEMRDHLCTEIYCHTKLLLDFINNLRNEMESMKKINNIVENKNLKKELDKIKEESKNEMESTRNDIVKLKSENKDLKNELDKIKIEIKNNQRINEEFEKKIKNNLSEIEELNEEMVVIKNENRSLMDKIENIEKSRIMQRESEQQAREIDEMKGKYKQTDNKEIEMRRIIDKVFDEKADLMKKSNNYDEKINKLQIKIIEMERIKEQINFGEFEWKIENFSQQQKRTNIYSESFYSHKYGYKMCLSAQIYDFYVDVYFHLMRGEFYNDLLWPFKHAITIDTINQMNGGMYTSETIKYDDCPNNQGWNKPATERNDPIEFHYPIKQSKEIIRNNQLLIKCKIKF